MTALPRRRPPFTSTALASLVALAGCVAHVGPWQAPDDTAKTSAVVDRAVASLVLVGNPGAPTRWAEQVGEELDRHLTAEDAAGRHPVVLWIGGLSLPRHPDRRRPQCPAAVSLDGRPGADAITAAVRDHVARGHESFAVAGIPEWRCGTADAMTRAEASAATPWRMPDQHYVVRVGQDGGTRLVSSCSGEPVSCTVASPESATAAADLVIVDLAPWVDPPRDAADRARKDEAVERLDALVLALQASSGGAAPPRILVSSVPVEGLGYSGMGGGGTDAAFHYLPPKLQAAVGAGVFAGALSAHDRAVYATADISPAVKRSSRAWLAAPMFQVVAGSASLPDSRAAAGGRRLRYFRSNSDSPPLYSDHAGFATVYVAQDRVAAVLRATHNRHWETATLEAPLAPTRFAAETPAQQLSPCAQCEMIPANEQ